ncbi:hypothetical protein F5146DRAFT_999110 [Armillaria mellea]|nr:hypothetical protein F5146DRAFT_999110 [Armillaria mellea]
MRVSSPSAQGASSSSVPSYSDGGEYRTAELSLMLVETEGGRAVRTVRLINTNLDNILLSTLFKSARSRLTFAALGDDKLFESSSLDWCVLSVGAIDQEQILSGPGEFCVFDLRACVWKIKAEYEFREFERFYTGEVKDFGLLLESREKEGHVRMKRSEKCKIARKTWVTIGPQDAEIARPRHAQQPHPALSGHEFLEGHHRVVTEEERQGEIKVVRWATPFRCRERRKGSVRPVFSNECSPSGFFGQKRYTPSCRAKVGDVPVADEGNHFRPPDSNATTSRDEAYELGSWIPRRVEIHRTSFKYNRKNEKMGVLNKLADFLGCKPKVRMLQMWRVPDALTDIKATGHAFILVAKGSRALFDNSNKCLHYGDSIRTFEDINAKKAVAMHWDTRILRPNDGRGYQTLQRRGMKQCKMSGGRQRLLYCHRHRGNEILLTLHLILDD